MSPSVFRCFSLISNDLLSAPEKKDIILEQLGRTNSVRDRMRKFTEASQSLNIPALKKTPLRNGSPSVNGGQTNVSRAAELFTHTPASSNTSGDTPGRPRAGSLSSTSAGSHSQGVPNQRGAANKPLSSASQSQGSVGGTRRLPAEQVVPASSEAEEDRTPGRAAGKTVPEGEEDPDMKTFLTIEIKDGRTTTSSTPRGNMVPIANMTPHITTLGQRPGRCINFSSRRSF